MDKIKAYDDKALRKSTRIAGVIAGIALIAMGFLGDVKYSAIIGIILLLAVIMGKATYVTEEGISIEYDFLVYKHIMGWAFEEITDVHIEDAPNREYQVLYFQKDVMTRRLIFRRTEVEAVKQMARQKNPGIHIEKVEK